jgi:RNA polymerase sigma factor (sigma-70 family)
MTAVALAIDPDVVAAAAGDRDAYTRLVSGHRNLVCSIALAIIGDVGASEDVAQGVFLAVWRGLRQLRNPASFLPWLRQLTRNQAHEHLRTDVRRRRRVTAVDDVQLAEAIDPAPDAALRLVTAEEQACFDGALDRLPTATREIVTLYYREGRSVEQVAALLGMRADAIKKRLERARTALRAEMLDRYAELAKRTAPGATFVAAVTAALVMSAPADAAVVGAAKAAHAAKTVGAWKAIAVALPGAALGLGLGVAGVVFGTLLGLRKARDAEERRALIWLGGASMANLMVFVAGVVLAGALASPALLVTSYAVAMVGFFYLYRIRLFRIVEPRWRAEELEDPGAAARHRRERLIKLVGFLVGGVGSGAGVAWAVAQMLSRSKS